MALSPEEQKAVAYIKERRKHRARTAGQIGGAAAGVLSGQGTMDAQLAQRDPYSGLSSPMQKMQQSMEIYDKMAEEEMALYKAGLKERSDRLKLNVEAMLKNRQISSTAKQASARLRLQGNIAAADRLDDQIESAMGLSPAVKAYVDKSAKMTNRRKAQGGEGFSVSSLLGDAVDGPKDQTAGGQSLKSGGGTAVAGTSGYNEDRGNVETGAEMMEQEFRWLHDNPNASVLEKRIHVNNIEAIAEVSGLDPGKQAYGNNTDKNGNPVPRGTNSPGLLLEDLYLDAANDVADYTSSEFEESEDIQVMLKNSGSGGATSEEAHAASMKEQVEAVYGEDWDPDAPLPGFGVVPKSKAHENYTKMIETINAQPEEPLVVSMKAEIQDSDYYNEWKTKMGYDDGADERMVWREWSQKAKQLEKDGRQKYREQRRKNIDDGLSKARGPAFGEAAPKPLAASASAKAVGGVDKKPEDVAKMPV